MKHPIALVTAFLILMIAGCDKVELISKGEEGGGNGTQGPEPTGPSNNIISWAGNTSYANLACLNGTTLTIKCRPYVVMARTLDITIYNYSGPGTYTMAAAASATYYLDNTYMVPPYVSIPSSTGSVTISSEYSTVGISGNFNFTLYRNGSPLTLSSGIIDQVPLQCAWPSDLLSYSVATLSPNHAVASVTSGTWTYQRAASTVVIQHRNTFGVSNPSTQWNDFRLTLPRSASVGTILNPSTLSDFAITYTRPSSSHYDTNHASSYLTIDEHDTQSRVMRGSYSVLLTGSLTASGSFNITY